MCTQCGTLCLLFFCRRPTGTTRSLLSSSSLCPPPLSPTLFPYTTLFRSRPETLPCPTSAIQRWRSTSTPVSIATCAFGPRSGEHTSELQSLRHLVCRLLLEKKKTRIH